MIKMKESAVKKLFQEAGIRVPAGIVVSAGRKAAPLPPALQKSPRLAVKALVPFGSRMKKGLVKLVRPASWFLAAHKIVCAAQVYGGCRELLVEMAVSGKKELYLSIFSDPESRGPVLFFSRKGGIDVENLFKAKHLYRLPLSVLEAPREELLRDFFKSSGCSDHGAAGLATISLALYTIYRRRHASFVEINPLLEMTDGFVALDGKISLDEDAASLVENPLNLSESCHLETVSAAESQAAEIDRHDYRGSVHFIQTNLVAARRDFGKKIRGFIGFNGVGTGVSLTAMDELVERGFYPRNFCDTSGNPTASKVYRATKIILGQTPIKGYFFISCLSSQQLDHTARGIIKAFREIYAPTGGKPTIPCVLVFRGAWEEEAMQLFHEHGIADSPYVRVLGREYTERNAVKIFEELFHDRAA